MNTKSLLVAAAVASVAITNAIAAASVRVGANPSFNATATPTTNSGAMRAGSLKVTPAGGATTMSTGAVSTSNAVNNGRMAFWNKNVTSKINALTEQKKAETSASNKETGKITADTRELESRLEALQSKFDDTVNELERIKSMLPELDRSGNITWQDPNLGLVSIPVAFHLDFVYGGETLKSRYGYTAYLPYSAQSEQAIQNFVDATCSAMMANDSNILGCSLEYRDWRTDKYIFGIQVISAGYYTEYEQMVAPGIFKRGITSYEYTTEQSLRDAYCGTVSNDLCWIEYFFTNSLYGYTYAHGTIYTKTVMPSGSDEEQEHSAH